MVNSMERWVGKTAIVTGASAGIGTAIVKQLVDHGMNVVGLARRVERIEELAKKLAGKKGKLYAVKADMTNEDDIIKAFQWTTKNVGPVHVLVNNAGVVKQNSLIGGNTEKWRDTLKTNVLAVCITTREAIEIMKANKIDGHIININSMAGHKVPDFINMNIYPASKFAITAICETLKNELTSAGLKIKVTSLSPGYVRTEIFAASIDDPKAAAKNLEYAKSAPALDAEDIAEGVIFALSTPPHVQIRELTMQPLGEQY